VQITGEQNPSPVAEENAEENIDRSVHANDNEIIRNMNESSEFGVRFRYGRKLWIDKCIFRAVNHSRPNKYAK